MLGGGVAGLTAAHELAERGFDVVVLESRPIPGGKARSLPVPGSGMDGRADLPAEHGFRFFPGFYRHIPDTMSRIPTAGGTVLDRLTAATRVMIARAGGRNELISAAHLPASLDDLGVVSRFLYQWTTALGIPAAEQAVLMERLLTLLTSCDERRYGQWEQQSWWEFVGAERRSVAFQKFLADGLTRTLVAARAREISARTGGLILAQLLFDITRVGGRADRVLDGPTNEAWIDPWVEYLRSLGVDLRLDCPVQGLVVDGERIAGVTTPTGTVTADFYVAALPVEIMRTLAGPPLRRLEPRLAALDRLVTRWMNGVLFYLDTDVPVVHGHTIYIDSEWALTSISQAQFWRDVDVGRYGDGNVRGILSVDVSDWETPGTAHGQGGIALQPRGDPRRGLGPARRSPQRRAATGPRRVASARLVPRSGDRVPEPDRGDQPRATADQHRRIVERPAGGDDSNPQPDAGRRLRTDEHRSGDDGGSQRGGPPRRQRDPRRDRLHCSTLQGVRPGRAGDPAPRAPARPAAVVVVPSPRPPTPARRSRRSAAATWCARAGCHRARPRGRDGSTE